MPVKYMGNIDTSSFEAFSYFNLSNIIVTNIPSSGGIKGTKQRGEKERTGWRGGGDRQTETERETERHKQRNRERDRETETETGRKGPVW